MYRDEKDTPGLKLPSGFYEKVYASCFTSVHDAELKHGKLIISPLGNISKENRMGP